MGMYKLVDKAQNQLPQAKAISLLLPLTQLILPLLTLNSRYVITEVPKTLERKDQLALLHQNVTRDAETKALQHVNFLSYLSSYMLQDQYAI